MFIDELVVHVFVNIILFNDPHHTQVGLSAGRFNSRVLSEQHWLSNDNTMRYDINCPGWGHTLGNVEAYYKYIYKQPR